MVLYKSSRHYSLVVTCSQCLDPLHGFDLLNPKIQKLESRKFVTPWFKEKGTNKKNWISSTITMEQVLRQLSAVRLYAALLSHRTNFALMEHLLLYIVYKRRELSNPVDSRLTKTKAPGTHANTLKKSCPTRMKEPTAPQKILRAEWQLKLIFAKTKSFPAAVFCSFSWVRILWVQWILLKRSALPSS